MVTVQLYIILQPKTKKKQDAISSLQGNLTDLQDQVNTNLYIGIGGGSIIGLVIRVAAVLVLRKKS